MAVQSIVMIVLSAMLLLTHPAYSQSKFPSKDLNRVVSDARGHVLKILQNQDSCAAWFQESDPDAAEIFQSLQYKLDVNGRSDVYRMRDDSGEIRDKHPWAASVVEYGGEASLVTLNTKGPFFKQYARLRTLNATGGFARDGDSYELMVGPYSGGTREARILILLHELGHIIGRIPVDDDSWNGDSARNTREVLRHCKQQISESDKKNPMQRSK
jgi:hypothetical protein